MLMKTFGVIGTLVLGLVAGYLLHDTAKPQIDKLMNKN